LPFGSKAKKPVKLSIKIEYWPIKGHFTIARSRLTDVCVLTVTLQDGPYIGRGECRPYPRYGETADSVKAQIEHIRSDIEAGLSRESLLTSLAAGAARNAVDCALWDLEAKRQDCTIWELWGQTRPLPKPTAFTLSLDSSDKMGKAAQDASAFHMLKLKVDAARMSAQIKAVTSARPDCRLIIDANESLCADDVQRLMRHSSRRQIALIEQPLHNDIVNETDFSGFDGPPLCADESLHRIDDLPRLKALGYKAVNIKLDKCGGVTAARRLIKAAKDQGFLLMGGCMLSTSLAVAPMAALMNDFDIIDLDGGALLQLDRVNGLDYTSGHVAPPRPELWG
jgi:L-alanine-DL-glutamate epimerase-like enolase superfamily enzyme